MGRASPAAKWRTAMVGGARTPYLEIGTGEPVVFLHGWGLTPRTYGTALRRLAGSDVRILAPTLPGFGTSGRVPRRAVSIEAYADHAAAFLEAVTPDQPAFVMGHSFGGGVALRLAYERPELVRSLTLLNSVGGSPHRPRDDREPGDSFDAAMTSRPWWQWAIAAAAEADPRGLVRMRPIALANLARAMVRDVVPNAVRRPITMARTAVLALDVDLVAEAHELVASGLPVLFVWGDRDRLILPGAFRDLRVELPAEVIPGRHGWLLTDPDAFGQLLRNALVVHAMLERRQRGHAVPRAGEPVVPVERRRRGRITILGTGGAS